MHMGDDGSNSGSVSSPYRTDSVIRKYPAPMEVQRGGDMQRMVSNFDSGAGGNIGE